MNNNYLIFLARNGVIYSVWSLASKEELEAGLAKWRRMLEDDTADQFIAEKEVQRKRLGYTTSIIAYKDLP